MPNTPLVRCGMWCSQLCTHVLIHFHVLIPSSADGVACVDSTDAQVETIDDYDKYCHYVAALVGYGLSRLFHAYTRKIWIQINWQIQWAYFCRYVRTSPVPAPSYPFRPCRISTLFVLISSLFPTRWMVRSRPLSHVGSGRINSSSTNSFYSETNFYLSLCWKGEVSNRLFPGGEPGLYCRRALQSLTSGCPFVAVLFTSLLEESLRCHTNSLHWLPYISSTAPPHQPRPPPRHQ